MSTVNSIQKWLQQNKIDIAYINNFKSIQYLTGFDSDPLERILSLIVFADHEPFIFAPALEVESIQKLNLPYDVYGYLDHENPFELISGHIKKRSNNIKTWSIEKKFLSIFQSEQLKKHFEVLKLEKDISPLIEELRLVKTEDEINLLTAAGKEADQAIQIGINAIKTGISENEIAAKIEYELKKLGIPKMSFDTLIQAGKHASEPHGATSDNLIGKNELVLLDLGTIHNSYISDISRTVAVGNLSQEQENIYNVCLEAQLAAQEYVRPGITAHELDKVARNVISKAGYGKYFIHRLGHGIGIEDHEAPNIMENNTMILKENMCFSIEPGIYIPGVAGVRIEDCVHVTSDGCIPFTTFDKKLQYI